MNKLIPIALLAAICGAGVAVSAQETVKKTETMKETMPLPSGMAMQMDSNRDGMVSKDEFMKHHEAMFDRMKKGPNGMVSVKDMGPPMPGDHPATKN